MSNKDIKQFIELLNTIAFLDLPISCPIAKKDKTMLLKGGSPDDNSIIALTETINNGLEVLSSVPVVKNNKPAINAINACSTTNYNIAELNNPYALAGTLLQNGADTNEVMKFALLLSEKQSTTQLELAKIQQQTQLALADKQNMTKLEMAKIESQTEQNIELAETYYNQKITSIGFLGGSVISAGLGALTYNGATNILSPITGLLGFAISGGDMLRNIDAGVITNYINNSGIEVPWGTQTIFSTVVFYLSKIIVLLVNGCLNSAGALIEQFSLYLKTIAESGVMGASLAVFSFSMIMTFFTITTVSKVLAVESIKLSPLGPELNFSSRKERRKKKQKEQTVTIEELSGGSRRKHNKPRK